MAEADQSVCESGIVPFFETHKHRTYQFAYQLTGNADDAMNLTQEAFLRLHRDWNRAQDPSHAVRRLFTTVRNLAIDLLRKRSAKPECEFSDELPDAQPRPDASAIQGQVSARLRAEIGALPLPLREALLLRDWHGMPYAEIAELTGASVATVTWRIHEARTILRQKMRRFL